MLFLKIFLSVGGIFGFLASLMAYFITYNEYVHHFQGDTREPRRLALQAGIFTFSFFIILSTLLAVIFSKTGI
jgi:hypothetical protein